MRNYKSLFVSLPLLVFTSVSLSADTFAVQLTGVGASDGAHYVLPYQLSIGGVDTAAICYDFLDEVSLNQTWSADVFSLNAAAAGGQFSNLGPAGALAGYEQVAWLSSLFFSESPATPLTTNDQIDLQHAIWNVFSPGSFTLPNDAFVNYIQTAESSGIAALNFDDYLFLEGIPDENGTRAQSFVLYSPGNHGGQDPSTPEPSGLVLLVIGLTLIGVPVSLRRTQDHAALN